MANWKRWSCLHETETPAAGTNEIREWRPRPLVTRFYTLVYSFYLTARKKANRGRRSKIRHRLVSYLLINIYIEALPALGAMV
jgi:hypothetical protein